jgi:hypothetical protein
MGYRPLESDDRFEDSPGARVACSDRTIGAAYDVEAGWSVAFLTLWLIASLQGLPLRFM